MRAPRYCSKVLPSSAAAGACGVARPFALFATRERGRAGNATDAGVAEYVGIGAGAEAVCEGGVRSMLDGRNTGCCVARNSAKAATSGWMGPAEIDNSVCAGTGGGSPDGCAKALEPVTLTSVPRSWVSAPAIISGAGWASSRKATPKKAATVVIATVARDRRQNRMPIVTPGSALRSHKVDGGSETTKVDCSGLFPVAQRMSDLSANAPGMPAPTEI